MTPKILISGGTGTIGSKLVDILQEKEADFTVMVRSSDQKASLLLEGITSVIADFNDPESLSKAFRDIHTLFLLSPLSLDMLHWQMTAIDIAALSGIKHIVKLSAIGASLNSPISIAQWHARIEQHLEASGINYTILRPASFMENELSHLSSIRYHNNIYAPLGDTAFNPIASADIARAAASILLNPATHKNIIYTLTGPCPITYNEIVRDFSNAIGKPIDYTPVSFEKARKSMEEAGLDSWLVQDFITMQQEWKKEKKAPETKTVLKLTGKNPMNFETFLMDHLEMIMP